jgi:hypothetical protein
MTHLLVGAKKLKAAAKPAATAKVGRQREAGGGVGLADAASTETLPQSMAAAPFHPKDKRGERSDVGRGSHPHRRRLDRGAFSLEFVHRGNVRGQEAMRGPALRPDGPFDERRMAPPPHGNAAAAVPIAARIGQRLTGWAEAEISLGHLLRR